MSSASWPPPGAFIGNRSMFMHQMQLNGPAAIQAAWLELSHSFRELSKLVDHMACAPTADKYYTIYNHHTALFAKLEDLEPSQEALHVPQGFGIPGPPSRANMPMTCEQQPNAEEALVSSPVMVHPTAHHQPPHELHHQTSLPPQSAQTVLPHQPAHGHPHAIHAKPAAHPMAPPQAHLPHAYRKAPRYAALPQAQQPGGPFITYHLAQPVSHPTVRPPPLPYAIDDQHYNTREAVVPAAAIPQPAVPAAAAPAPTAASAERTKRKPMSRRVPLSKGSPSSESIGTPEEDSESDERHHKRKKKNRKEKRNPMHRDMTCHQCGVRETPEWRRGPDGSHTLCNACGLRFSKLMRKKGEEEAAAEPTPQATPTHISGEVGALSEQLELPVHEEVPFPGETPPFGTNA